jgi:redox-sensing transcriptional repressor
MATQAVSDIVVERLPLYMLTLEHMQAEGITVASSQMLATRLGLTAAQIRKDLSRFGEFGKQGSGYNVPFLIRQLRSILNVDRTWDVALVGVGHIGRAILAYPGFVSRGFRISMAFDNNPALVGSSVDGVEIYDTSRMKELVGSAGVCIAILAVPASVAQSVANEAVGSGVRAILSYAPVPLKVPDGIVAQTMDPSLHLQHMTYYLS